MKLLIASSLGGSIDDRRRQRETEQRALAGCGFHPNAATVPLYNTLTNSEADARPGIGVPVEAFENAEDLLRIDRFDPDAVVSYREEPVSFSLPGGNMDSRRIRAAILNSVSDQVLKELHEPYLVPLHCGQTVESNRSAILFDGSVQVKQHLLHHSGTIHQAGPFLAEGSQL